MYHSEKNRLLSVILIQLTSQATEGGVDGTKKWKWVRGNSEVEKKREGLVVSELTGVYSYLIFIINVVK